MNWEEGRNEEGANVWFEGTRTVSLRDSLV